MTNMSAIKFKFINFNELAMTFALTSKNFVNTMSECTGAALKIKHSLEQLGYLF